MEIQKYPLLVQGLYSTPQGTQSSFTAIGAGTRVDWSNTITSGRGDMVMIDVMPSQKLEPKFTEAIFTLAVGGMQIIQNAALARYAAVAVPRSGELLKIKQRGGQTIQFSATGSTGNAMGAVVHVYYENKFATPEIIAARSISDLKPRIVEFTNQFSGGNKYAQSRTFTVPTNIGNVVAIELEAYDDASQGNVAKSLFSVAIGGQSIFENVAGNLFQYNTARPGLIWPILIRGTETFVMSADTSAVAAAQPVVLKIRLYLDNDATGTRQYPTLQ